MIRNNQTNCNFLQVSNENNNNSVDFRESEDAHRKSTGNEDEKKKCPSEDINDGSDCPLTPPYDLSDQTIGFLVHPRLADRLSETPKKQEISRSRLKPQPWKTLSTISEISERPTVTLSGTEFSRQSSSRMGNRYSSGSGYLSSSRWSDHSLSFRKSSSSALSFGESRQATPSLVELPAEKILFDIAQGKWDHKGLVIDEDVEGSLEVKSVSCPNAYCVRAAAEEKRQTIHPDKEASGTSTVFQDGNLPSYHSLLNIWQYEEEKKRFKWLEKIFSNGPENDAHFLEMWRECRRNPDMFGIKISEPKEIPDLPTLRASKIQKPKNKFSSTLFAAKANAIVNEPPKRKNSREYYSNIKPVSFKEQEVQRKKYEKYRALYPHLPILSSYDYRVNQATVKYRLQQADQWHRLVLAGRPPRQKHFEYIGRTYDRQGNLVQTIQHPTRVFFNVQE